MTQKPQWQQETWVRPYEAGADGRASIAVICNLLQACAVDHAEHLGIGYKPMKERRLAWAVARMGIEIHRKPVAHEGLTVRTWINGTRGPFAMREFVVLDASSTTIVRATYAWLAIDIESRKPVRPGQLVANLPSPPDHPFLDAQLGKLPDPVNPLFVDSIRAHPSDLDMHLHVNNSRYVTWIDDALSAVSPGESARWLHVNFLAEAFAGDTINVTIGAAPVTEFAGADTDDGDHSDRKIVVLSRAEDSAELVRALVVLKPSIEETGEMVPFGKSRVVNEATLEAASKIVNLDLTPSERTMARETVAGFCEDFRKLRKVKFDNELSPAEVFMPRVQQGAQPRVQLDARGQAQSLPSARQDLPPVPADETDLAYAPLRHLSEWLRTGKVSSTRLCEIYFERMKRYDPALLCVVSLTKELAFEQAKRADDEIRRGLYRGPLHGVPWGAKDLLDTKGILTTWGATPFKERIPDSDAAVVKLLEKAGAVLLAKLSLGALAYGDIWFGGKTRNPWNTQQGSSGSSAGPAAAAVAGLAGFCIGSETMGSIVSPALRCGAAGLRPSFGRVPRTGAMALSWSYDKLGPICRRTEDACYVLEAISAVDPGDPASVDLPFAFNPGGSIEGKKIGYDPQWFPGDREGIEYTSLLETISKTIRDHGAELVDVALPDLPYETLYNLITIDAAAAFEELTLSNRDHDLVWQEPEAWPNKFRAARFFPAVEYVQLQRFRRMVIREMELLFSNVDAMISPEHSSSLLVITNSTGQPSLTVRAGFRDDGTPFGLNIWGHYAGEETICRIGIALEHALGVTDRRPPGFD